MGFGPRCVLARICAHLRVIYITNHFSRAAERVDDFTLFFYSLLNSATICLGRVRLLVWPAYVFNDENYCARLPIRISFICLLSGALWKTFKTVDVFMEFSKNLSSDPILYDSERRGKIFFHREGTNSFWTKFVGPLKNVLTFIRIFLFGTECLRYQMFVWYSS